MARGCGPSRSRPKCAPGSGWAGGSPRLRLSVRDSGSSLAGNSRKRCGRTDMAMFAKKVDGDSKLGMDAAVLPATTSASPRGGYGIAETIQLMRELPGDQNSELVVKVVRATLASLNVRLPD